MKTEAEIGEMHLQAKKHQGGLATTRSWKRQGRILPWRLWREHGPTAHSFRISDLQNCERIIFAILSFPACGTSLWQLYQILSYYN